MIARKKERTVLVCEKEIVRKREKGKKIMFMFV